MAQAGRFEGDVHVAGTLTGNTITLPNLTVTNAMVASAAGLTTGKMRHRMHTMYAQESGTAAADEARPLAVVYGAAGELVSFKAGSVVICIGAATVTVDLLKDGVSVLTSVITLDSANSAYTPEAGTIDTAAVVAGDVLEVSINETAGGGTVAKGVYCELVYDEDPA